MNTGKVGSSEDLSLSDEVVPAYPKNRTLASHVEGLKFPYGYKITSDYITFLRVSTQQVAFANRQ